MQQLITAFPFLSIIHREEIHTTAVKVTDCGIKWRVVKIVKSGNIVITQFLFLFFVQTGQD